MRTASWRQVGHVPDLGVCRALNAWGARGPVRAFFALVSRLGDGVLWYVLIGAVAVSDGARGVTVALELALTGLVALTLYRLLKSRTRRPRPYAQHREIVARIAPLDEFSFPSGHTLHAVAFSTVAIANYEMLALVLIPFTTCVALSRVVLGLHYPSDVLAATAIGSALAFAVLGIAPP